MATVTMTNSYSIQYDEYDLIENKVIGIHSMLNPAVEFYLKNLTGISKAVVVGAGIGVFSKILTEAGVESHNIEPNSERFGMLESNVPGGINIKKAISDSSSSGTLKWFSATPSGSKLDTDNGSQSESVDVVTLDSLNISDVDLVVINVNGKEKNVLDGAATTILPGTKIIVKWNTEKNENLADFKTWLQNQSKKKYILHWESEDNSITKKEIGVDYDWDTLDVVIDADILIE
jgi:FkbM family methyltransferase|tara:strand:- start:2050 stop:2748 length:699 start_codon:yes stop_codon:yes gene_type:complete